MMKTQEALTRFLKKCEERGLAPETRRTYYSFLRHFADEHPELPTETKIIEAYLKKRKETPAHRGTVFKKLQAFYSYLEQFEGIKSPVPPRGPMGRPRKVKLVTNPASPEPYDFSTLQLKKVVQGGSSVGEETESALALSPQSSMGGRSPGSTSLSISTVDAVTAFIKSRQVQGVSKRTMEGYYSYFKPFIGKFPMLPTTSEQIEEFLGSLMVDPETRWSYNKTLKALYHFLERRKKIPKELIDFPMVKFPRKVRRVLTEDELRRLFPFAENFKEKAILILLIDSKVRASELLSLDREKVYQDHITVTGKTGERDVPINPETYGVLVQLALSGPLFTVNGKRMRREYLRIIVRRLMERAGLSGEKLGPHILRHSASVQHMMHGGDLLSLKEELGHTTTRQTEKYGKLAFPQVKQRHQEVNVLGGIVDQADIETNLERAICYGCKQQIVIAWLDVKKTKCPNCGQVGRWYLPNHRTEEVEA
ncbi:Tyrosine recombinase XerC [subsurface metagenome]